MLEVHMTGEACDAAEIVVNGVFYDWEYDLLREGRRCIVQRCTNLECAIAWAARDYYTNVEELKGAA